MFMMQRCNQTYLYTITKKTLYRKIFSIIFYKILTFNNLNLTFVENNFKIYFIFLNKKHYLFFVYGKKRPFTSFS